MLYFNRIDEFDICHYWHLSNYSSKFQQNVCNRFHDLLMMSMNLRDIAVLNIKGPDYCCVISLITKSWGHKLNAKYRFNQKTWSILKEKNLLSHIKICKEILTFSKLKLKKNKFYRNKTDSYFLKNVDIEKVLVSDKNFKCYKYL